MFQFCSVLHLKLSEIYPAETPLNPVFLPIPSLVFLTPLKPVFLIDIFTQCLTFRCRERRHLLLQSVIRHNPCQLRSDVSGLVQSSDAGHASNHDVMVVHRDMSVQPSTDHGRPSVEVTSVESSRQRNPSSVLL